MPNITCMPLNQTLIQAVADYATEILKTQLPAHFYYHSYEHTLYVVRAAELIAEKEGFSDEKKAIVKVACWFHDVGNIVNPVGHEAESCVMAKAFLEKHDLDSETINQILACIMATRMPQNPQNDLEKVVCDADLYYLSQPEFQETSLLLRKEWEVLFQRYFTDAEFMTQNIKFLEVHRYWTNFGQKVLARQKEKVIVEQKKAVK